MTGEVNRETPAERGCKCSSAYAKLTETPKHFIWECTNCGACRMVRRQSYFHSQEYLNGH